MNDLLFAARADRRDVLRGALGLAAGALGATLAAGSVAQASPSSGFAIKIDATPLVYRDFIIPGVTNDWVDSRTIQSLVVAPGLYSFQVASGYFADFTFSVTPRGTIDYDTAYDAFLGGRGTSTLTINGFQVTLDARYLSGSGVLLVIPATNDDWITYKQCRMVPASYYSVQQGSGEVANFSFKLGLDGHWSYDAAHDVTGGGFLAGRGTATLAFYGYPLLIDARAAGGWGVTVVPIWGMPFSLTSVAYANLLPASNFSLLVHSGVVSPASFSLAPDGTFAIASGATSLLQLDTYHGLRRLTVVKPL